MKVLPLGFFSDLNHGLATQPSLNSVIANAPSAEEAELVQYLRSGELFIASPGVTHDVLAEEKVVIGSPDILTDGVWAWPRDLAHYVEQYHARLPEKFLAHARKNGWRVPEDIDVLSLELAVD